MRRANDLLPRISDPDNLRLAVWKAAKGKRYAAEVLGYQADLEANLRALREQVESGQVEVGDYRHFTIHEPKERQICASAFREQVLHHALMNVCHPVFERAQVFDSYASRKGKGTYAALDRAKAHTLRYGWFLKLDVQKFFDSISHDVVKGQLARLFKEQRLLGIFFQIIDSFGAERACGVPIGNLTSQYFANHYLSGLDHFVKEELGIAAYVRYMDDMVLWHDDQQVLQAACAAIQNFVENRLRCSLKPAVLHRTKQGLPFLGYKVLPHDVRLLQKSKVRFARKMVRVEAMYHAGIWHERACQHRAAPLAAFTRHADAAFLRKRVLLRLQGQSSKRVATA